MIDFRMTPSGGLTLRETAVLYLYFSHCNAKQDLKCSDNSDTVVCCRLHNMHQLLNNKDNHLMLPLVSSLMHALTCTTAAYLSELKKNIVLCPKTV